MGFCIRVAYEWVWCGWMVWYVFGARKPLVSQAVLCHFTNWSHIPPERTESPIFAVEFLIYTS